MHGCAFSFSFKHRPLADPSVKPTCFARKSVPTSVVMGETSGEVSISSLG